MRTAFWFLAVLSLASSIASAQTTAPPVRADHGATAPLAVAARASEPIRVDGRLDEAAWAAATPITEFTQLVPREGEPATQRTEVRILHSAEALYVGARLYDREPVSTRLVRRDGPMDGSDWLTVILDSYHDHRSAFGFEVNPSGVRRDQTRTIDAEDDSWDPVWEVATTVDEEGWTVEMRIPFSQLRFNPVAGGAEAAPGARPGPQEQVWGIQLERTRARNQEFSVFSFTPTTEPGGIPRFGHLVGLRDITTAKRLEVLPYSVLRAESVDRAHNPFRDDRDVAGSLGMDLKYRVTSDLTLDATINPDFGQVEVDPAQVNLTAFETRFQEKRPFFVEGAEIFSFGTGGGNEVFYSRRLGGAPHLRPQTPAADVPEAARILGAGKLSGRTRTGWSVGVLNATTRREEARFLTPQSEVERMAVEPLTNYFVARLRRDSRAGQSVVGGMFTAVNRKLDSELLRAGLHANAATGGLDFRQQWAERTWTLTGFLSGSYVQGDPAALIRTQRTPWRYFQRPDAPGLRVDSSATSLAGLATEVQLQHRRGRHWRFGLLAGTITPGYEVNDIGFQVRANRIDQQATIDYLENRPGRLFRSWNVGAFGRTERNYDGEHIISQLGLNGNVQTLGYWRSFVNVQAILPSTDDRLTRGGPLARRPGSVRGSLNVYSDNRRPVWLIWESAYQRDDAGGWNGFVAAGVEARPAPNVSLMLVPVLSRMYLPAQYLAAVPDALAEHTYGARYIFATLDQTTARIETRLNVTFTPGLSLQVYAQPFISGQAFGTPAELAAPRTYDFLVYGRDTGRLERTDTGYEIFPTEAEDAQPLRLPYPDFNVRSLRGNAVLRWEWRAGSTFYLAWQQTRFDRAAVGDFDFGRDRAALFAAPADNVLVLKMNYWLNP